LPETVVICGEVSAPKGAQSIIRLATTGSRTNVALHGDDIGERLLRSVTSVSADLLDVAAYIYAADQLVSRGGPKGHDLGKDWRRDLRFILPVREPDRWASTAIQDSLRRRDAVRSDPR
jgi:hypothetical protein